jgi:hypothetical protein
MKNMTNLGLTVVHKLSPKTLKVLKLIQRISREYLGAYGENVKIILQ